MMELPLPALGADMESGKLLEWRVKPGDAISKGTIIAVVDTEKAAIDVESWHDGVVTELLVAPGQTIAVGTAMLRLQESATQATIEPANATANATANAPANAPAPPPAAPAAAESARASPAARARARELGISLAAVHGTGPAGAVTLADVMAASPAAPSAAADALDRNAMIRAAIALAMERSHREIPQYYLWQECDVSAALQWLRQTNDARPVERRLVLAALMAAAVARAAREFPDMNGSYESAQFRSAANVHLGIAVALRGGGLIAPAIRDADTLTLDDLMQQLSDLVRRTRAGGLRSSEVTGQTLTLTQLGDEGTDGVLGIIHPPQVALVGIGRARDRAVVNDGRIEARTCVTISLAADHRVSDGRRGSMFIARIASLLGKPAELAPCP